MDILHFSKPNELWLPAHLLRPQPAVSPETPQAHACLCSELSPRGHRRPASKGGRRFFISIIWRLFEHPSPWCHFRLRPVVQTLSCSYCSACRGKMKVAASSWVQWTNPLTCGWTWASLWPSAHCFWSFPLFFFFFLRRWRLQLHRGVGAGAEGKGS